MHLLSQNKIGREKKLQEADLRVANLKVQIKEAALKKKLIESTDWDKKKEKEWLAYCKWNQQIQSQKATLLMEIEELEVKKERLIENLKAYISD